jgi:hypothetical protein
MMSKSPSKTIRQISNNDGWPKARELIEFTGHHVLEAADRAILNTLYQIAHDSGRMSEADAEWEIPLGDLRPSKTHKGNERVRSSLDRLLSVVVTVPYVHAKTGEERVILTNLFGFIDVSSNEDGERATLRFGLPKKLQTVLSLSGQWGRIRAEIVMAMTSKYAIALYELVQARANLDRCVETIPLDRFRELMGVPPGKLERGSNLKQFCIDPAVLEVNGISDIGVTLELRRKGNRATGPIEAVTLAWWRKEGDDYREAIAERNRPKVGRMARLKGTVETMK